MIPTHRINPEYHWVWLQPKIKNNPTNHFRLNFEIFQLWDHSNQIQTYLYILECASSIKFLHMKMYGTKRDELFSTHPVCSGRSALVNSCSKRENIWRSLYLANRNSVSLMFLVIWLEIIQVPGKNSPQLLFLCWTQSFVYTRNEYLQLSCFLSLFLAQSDFRVS